MQRLAFLFSSVILSTSLFTSCMKEEKPYPLPTLPVQEGEFEIKNSRVSIGENYETQVFFSFNTGLVATANYKSWDISFTTDATTSELWMNGGNEILIYPTGSKDYGAEVAIANIPAQAWVYDNSSWLAGKSGLGILSNDNHIGEVLIVHAGAQTYYKLQITEITPTSYTIKSGPLTSKEGTIQTLDKDENYNYIYFSFNGGIVKPEPPKTDWDIVFTRYRYVYIGQNEDGSDFPYVLNGVLTNPYKTVSGDDTVNSYDFYSFDLAKANSFTLSPDRDIIGFDWKSVNINTGQYKVKPQKLFVVQDQNNALWKLHFVNFYDENNKKGYPQFEYQRLK